MRKDDTLIHYGILGQKWGVRRYQNSDGSLTDEGREHYGYKTARDTSARFRSSNTPGQNVSVKDVKRNMDRMTDAELQRAINRINMQQQVNSMDKSTIDKGLSALKKVTSSAATVLAAKAMAKKVTPMVKDALGDLLLKTSKYWMAL